MSYFVFVVSYLYVSFINKLIDHFCWGKRERERAIFLLSFTCNYVVSVWRVSFSSDDWDRLRFYCDTPWAFHIIILRDTAYSIMVRPKLSMLHLSGTHTLIRKSYFSWKKYNAG